MNPEQCNNHALRQQHQRAAESRTEEELLAREAGSTPTGELSAAPKTARVVEEIFAATQPPWHATSSAVMGGGGALSKAPELERGFSEESRGGTSAASMASSVSVGPVALGLGPGLDIGRSAQVRGEDAEMSPRKKMVDRDKREVLPGLVTASVCGCLGPAGVHRFGRYTAAAHTRVPGWWSLFTQCLTPMIASMCGKTV